MQKILDSNGKVIDYSYTSPFGISILIHYRVSHDTPYEKDSPESRELIDQFLKMGLLVKEENGNIVSNREALAIYVSALTKVPLPRLKQKWVIED